MKLGIVGAGLIVREFLPHLVRLDGLEVSGLMSTPASIGKVRALARENGVPCAASDFEELCAAGIDTVYAAAPNSLHFSFCRRALERGLNVIVEKPMASNYREAKELSGLARAKRLFLFEAVTTPYLGNYQKVGEWLPRVGDIKLVQSQFTQYSSRYGAFRGGEVPPVFDPAKAGGALMDLGPYCLHFVMGLFGKPQAARYRANVERGIDTGGVLTMRYPGFQALCVTAKDCGGVCGSVIQGAGGVIRTELAPNLVGRVTLSLYDGTGESYDDGGHLNRAAPEFAAFIRAVNAGDYGFCYAQLDRSLAVSEVQTRARLEAGIVFPADNETEKLQEG